MPDGQERRTRVRIHERIVLQVVDRGDHHGFVIPHRDGAATFRGTGSADYVCGTCGSLIAIGVRPGMFRNFVFACACGGLNELG